MTRRTVVHGGTLVDGTGAPRRPADLLIEDGRIAVVGEPGSLDAVEGRRRDATELVVCPGFIDVHSHADGSSLLPLDDVSKILQGVTTEIVGNCGTSLSPLGAGDREVAGRLLAPGCTVPWAGVGEHLAHWRDRDHVTNVGVLVGHGTLREAVLGTSAHPADDEALRAMQVLLEDGLAAGALGLSSGLVYAPGVFATPEELRGLVRVLGPEHVYATHLRNESDRLLESVDEAVATVDGLACRLQISHLKVTGRRNHGRVRLALDRLDVAREAGLRVRQDVYPYAAASTTLTACLPPWALAGGEAALLSRLADATQRDRIRREVHAPGPHDWENPVASAGWDRLVIAGTASGRDEGRSLADLAAAAGMDPFDTLVNLLRRERARASMVEHSMSENDVERVLCHPETIVASDGLPATAGAAPHPRLHGTFPRVLGPYVRERGLLTLEQAVRKITGLPAETFSLSGRGVVAAGTIADLVAFDPAAVADRATYAHPSRAPTGVAWVMQQGRLSVDHGSWLGRRRGRLLTPAGRSSPQPHHLTTPERH